ncbi:hypothetical protein K32_27780 [Kaistia sp. 32K]|uniref:transporter substrate-binding domain-containing protein n=1 Tax=Kaistia sp. 32K TaxID=2795690 RepID=UPI001915010A|nr:transporter substrate-binding domain-containing protein [Kaistia sp. 32K]BCP54161.1 hypothetical protein K32_27780 [Kaistia sp. 32K]
MSQSFKTGILCALALAAATVPSFAAEAQPSFVGDKVFTVCTDATFPPMEFFESAGNAEPVGFDIDLAKALAGHWGAESRIIVSEFTGLLPGLDAGRCDAVISGIPLTPERVAAYPGVPYFSTAVVVFAGDKSGLVVNDATDLSGKVVAVQAGTSYLARLEKINETLAAAGRPAIKIQTYPKQTDVIQQVLVGRAEAAVSQDTELAYRNLQKEGQFKTLYSFPDTSDFAVFIKRVDGDEAAVSAAVAALVKDGSLGEIAKKWGTSVDSLVPGVSQ